MHTRISWSKMTLAGLVSVTVIAAASGAVRAAEVRVAVAANFTDAVKEIGARFQKSTGHSAVFSFGPTGGLYNQITQAAPFEVFLSADQATPAIFTYATGRLVLFSKTDGLTLGEATLKNGKFTKIAIANPKTAPYGAAAVEVMQKLGVYDALKGKIVEGNNIAQTFQFVDTGNAEVGFVAFAQVALKPGAQDAVLLKTGAGNEAAKAFLGFLKGLDARAVIEKYGYGFVD